MLSDHGEAGGGGLCGRIERGVGEGMWLGPQGG